MGSLRFGFVIPTKDRPGDLRRLLASLRVQTVRPDQLVIADGSEATLEGVVAEFADLPITYRRVHPPSLARQRNAGMEVMSPAMTHAGYLDDDLLFEPDAMAAMRAWWERAPADAGGAGFNIVNQRPGRGLALKSVFLMDSVRRGVVLPSGYNTPIGAVTETIDVQWLYGGATVWRRGVIEQVRYDEWFEGLGYLEDLDYSYRVAKQHRLFVVADARIQHLTSYEIRRDRNYLFGKWQAINRMYFVRKHQELSPAACLWALVGQTMVNLTRVVSDRDPGGLLRAAGNAAGLAMVMLGRLERMGGTFKTR